MIRRLLLLNGFAVLGAVLNHATGWGFTAMYWWTDRYTAVAVPHYARIGDAAYYALRAIEQLIMFSIPAFLFVSGFFVAFATGRQRENVGWSVIGNRIKSLLIPYVIWSAAIFGLWALQDGLLPWYAYVRSLLFGRAAAPYYYVPLLTQFFLLSPLLFVPLARKRWKLLLLLTGIVQLLVHLAQYPLMLGWDFAPAQWVARLSPGWFVPQTIFWFAFGMVAGFHLPLFKGWLARWKWALLGGTAVFWLLAFVEWELLFRASGVEWLAPGVTLLDSLYAGCFILAYMAFEKAPIPYAKQWSDLGTKSFGVYLIHAPVQEIVARGVYHAAPNLLPYQMVFMPLLVITGLAVPLLLMAVVNRTALRPYYQYLFG